MSTTNQAKVVSVKLVKGSIQIKLSNSVKFSQDQYLWESKLFEANAVDVCLLTRDKGGGGHGGTGSGSVQGFGDYYLKEWQSLVGRILEKQKVNVGVSIIIFPCVQHCVLQ